MEQLFLLDRYPLKAGAKEPTTSLDAAIRIERSGRAEALRHACLRELAFPHTAKEVAEILGEDKCSVRPRIAELKARGLVVATGLRRKGEFVWQAAAQH